MALRVGGGFLEAGLAMAAGATPYGYVDFREHMAPNLALFAQGRLRGLADWDASAGLRWVW